MAVNISGKYIGDLKVELAHGPSGARIKTVAPVDNQGDGSTFSPTDLVASAFGACMMTLIGIAAKKHNINLDGLRFSLEKHMASDPRRIGSTDSNPHARRFGPGGQEEARARGLDMSRAQQPAG